MDITLTWALPINQLPTDEYDVLYKVWDANGINNWVLANTTPLPPTTTTYTITGLNPNTIYRVAVTKSCVGGGSYVDESTYVNIVCPIISFWQGPVVNSEQTLFYSVNYPDATHVTNTEILVYDTTFDDRFLNDCGTGPTAIPIGRTSYQIADGCTTPNIVSCVKQILDFKVPNTGASGVGYYGLDTVVGFNPFLCDGSTTDPILFREGNTYKFELNTIIDTVSLGVTIDFSTVDTTCKLAPSAPVYTFTSHPIPDTALLSSALCFDPLTGLVSFTTGDGTGTTNVNDYTFSYSTSDGVSPAIPLLDNAGNPITVSNGSYNIYAPIKIQTYAPGGGTALGYTITNAVVAGGNTTYTYTGGTNAFTVGQDVFVNNINPTTFSFPLVSKTITAATPNSFTVSFTPAGTYQTGGIASGYTELTDGMTITVDLLPGPLNVITLTNQNYSGLTLIQALTQIATAINNAGTYTASAVVIAGLPYLKIDVPDSTYTSASVMFEGPNILTKGAPDILQTSSAGTINSTPSSVSYNGFLYAAFNEATAKIVASDINNPTSATNYSHTIDTTINEIVLVPQAPPSTAYSLDYLTSGGNHSLNIATNSNLGYVYVADNTTVSIYDGTTLIDSQDLSLLGGGPTTPIRLMEYNTTDNYLYVFVDGASFNFHIVLNPSVGVWSIGHTGTYGQTNYLERGTITAYNNLTTGPTAAMGTITSAPIAPIPLGTIPNPPNNTIANTLSFQDSTKSWAIPPIYNYNEYQATTSYTVYNYTQQTLGLPFYYGAAPFTYPGISGTTVQIHNGVNTSGVAIPFTASNGDSYGIFHSFNIVDYNANFTSRTWANTSRYLIENGRNAGSNGFLNTTGYTSTVFKPDVYQRTFNSFERMIKSGANYNINLDGTSEYLLYEITDGGTCYNSTSNLVYVSLGNGTYQTIASSGTVSIPRQIYKDYPTNSVLLNAPLQLVADPNNANVYGIIRDARLDPSLDDSNIYILGPGGQIGLIDGSLYWNEPICGKISFDSDFLYFTAKYSRNFCDYNISLGTWNTWSVPSVYEKLDGFTYGDGTIIERIQGATHIGGNKFVIMNYLQQTYSTELKYACEVSNLFVFDYNGIPSVSQVLIGTGVNTYSGTPASYNPNRYGESFGFNDYNNDYCYGGLSIAVDSNGRIFWKKAISDQIYMSEAHAESGVAQIWGSMPSGSVGLMRIWNIQSDGSLVQSKRTIIDYYSSWTNLIYDSYYEKVLSIPSGLGYQIYLANPKTLGGLHGVNTIGQGNKNVGVFMNGLTPSMQSLGKPSTVYGAIVTPASIEYSVRPAGTTINGVFPHHYAVGDVVLISSIISTPALELNFASATIISVTQTTFTIANTTGTAATYTSGGTVRLATYANMWATGTLATDNSGIIYLWGPALNGIPYLQNSSMIFQYRIPDILTQRESPDFIAIGNVSSPCSATADSVFRVGTTVSPLTEYSIINVASQGTLWILGSKNPSCPTTNITNVTYDPIAQTVRYYINNSFLVGKVVNISGVNPATYNLNRVAITAVDTVNSPQQWFEISYTGSNPGTFVPPTPPSTSGTVQLSTNYVIAIYDITTINPTLITTIDLGFINEYLDYFINSKGSFQYSAAEEKIYLYSFDPASPVYIFDTITNSLIKSSSFNRMTLGYGSLSCVYTLEDVNGIPYFSAYTAADTPTRRWFRLDLGSRSYLNNTHNELDIISSDGLTTITDTYDLYSFTNLSDTFGQWKVNTDTTWASIPGGSNITVNANEIIEFTMFSTSNTLLSVENITTSTVYDVPSYNNLATFPTYNTLNSMLVFVIKADSVNLSNGDVLQFTFDNPQNPSCPFINSVTINF